MSVAPLDRSRIALLAVAVLVVLAGCSAGGGGDAAGPDGGDGSAGGNGASGLQAAAGDVGSFYADDGERVVVREAAMSLRVTNFSRAFVDVRAVAREHGGYLADRSQSTEGAWDRGRIAVRVPAGNFTRVRDALASLGRVEHESVSVKDFTTEYRSLGTRIDQLAADATALRGRLNATSNSTAVAEIRDELESVRVELAELRGERERLHRREALSTITLTMHEPSHRKPVENHQSVEAFGAAFENALYGGLVVVKGFVATVGFLVPVGLALVPLGLATVAGVRGWREAWPRVRGALRPDHRREHPPDGSQPDRATGGHERTTPPADGDDEGATDDAPDDEERRD